MAITKTHTKVIEGITYTTTTLPASAGLTILPKVMSIFGEALIGLFFAVDDESKAEVFANPKVLGAIIAKVAENAAADNALLVLKDLLVSTECDRVSIGDAEVPGNVHSHFDGHFAGRYRHLMEVALWVGTSNFIAP